ncbi:BID domain-containing T4SS effector [Bartonella sp. CB169]|uniref:BID domain-containing T4SS effector n=1 Tax=Bartonella sp. CB169 TaxID=3112257 RepID=UPI00300E310E
MPKEQLEKTNGSPTTPSPYNYVYLHTDTLKNKYGIQDPIIFKERCARDVAQALININEETLPLKFDSHYLKHLHKEMFMSMFEWAGCTRNEKFTFSDGSTAFMPIFRETGLDTVFATGDEIQENLQKLDQTLSAQENLQNLSREQLISKTSKIFISLKHTHPFRYGNEHVEQLFCEKFFQAANHRLDFSLATSERIKLASIAAIRDGNLEPIEHLFEDISNPKKQKMLKDVLKTMGNDDISSLSVMVAKEGEIYSGVYKDTCSESFILKGDGTLIIGDKSDLTKQQLKKLQTGETFTFKTPIKSLFDKFFIPKNPLPPLTKNEIAEKLSEDACVHTCYKQVQKLSKIVYGNPKALNKKMIEVIKNPNYGQQLVQEIERSPSSIANLAGFDFFYFKNQARANSENHISMLCSAVANYESAIRYAQKEIIQEHKVEQERCKQEVSMPSKKLQDFLSLSKDSQKEALDNSLTLQTELCTFQKSIRNRLSKRDYAAINDNDYKALAKSIGVPEEKAKGIAETVQKFPKVQQPPQIRPQNRLKAFAISS